MEIVVKDLKWMKLLMLSERWRLVKSVMEDFIVPIDDVIRIRTGERGGDAI